MEAVVNLVAAVRTHQLAEDSVLAAEERDGSGVDIHLVVGLLVADTRTVVVNLVEDMAQKRVEELVLQLEVDDEKLVEANLVAEEDIPDRDVEEVGMETGLEQVDMEVVDAPGAGSTANWGRFEVAVGDIEHQQAEAVDANARMVERLGRWQPRVEEDGVETRLTADQMVGEADSEYPGGGRTW